MLQLVFQSLKEICRAVLPPTHPILVGAPRLCPEIQQTHQTEFSSEMSERCQTDRRLEALISLLKRQNLNNIIFYSNKKFYEQKL